MLRLDFRNRHLGEVVDALSIRYDLGLSLRLGPEPGRGLRIFDPGEPDRLKELRDRVITLEAAQPLPFWKAIDRLCKPVPLRYDLSRWYGFGTGQGFLVLMPDRRGHGPVSDSGPFRVQIIGARSAFETDFILDPEPPRRRARPPGTGDLIVPLAVLSEPGMMLRQNGAVVVTEAIDDRGRSLVLDAPPVLDLGEANRSRQDTNHGASILANAVLAAPDPAATLIRRLRGKVPVIAVAKGSDPLIIPLKGEGVLGRPFSTRDLTLVVDETSLAPGGRAWVKVSVRFNRGDRATFARSDQTPPTFAGYNLGGVLEHLELHDADGRRLNHTLGEQMRSVNGDRYQLIDWPASGDGPAGGPGTAKTPIPAELRYYGFVQRVMEVPFDFRDVPMP